MQPNTWMPWVQATIAFAALSVAAAAITHVVAAWNDERNARLVEIGVGILRTDPDKEKQVSAAREWALDLIDANSGRVKFSAEARKALLSEALRYKPTYNDNSYTGGAYSDYGGYGTTDYEPGPPQKFNDYRPGPSKSGPNSTVTPAP